MQQACRHACVLTRNKHYIQPHERREPPPFLRTFVRSTSAHPPPCIRTTLSTSFQPLVSDRRLLWFILFTNMIRSECYFITPLLYYPLPTFPSKHTLGYTYLTHTERSSIVGSGGVPRLHPLWRAEANLRVLPQPAGEVLEGSVPDVSHEPGSSDGTAFARCARGWRGFRPLRGLRPAEDHLRIRHQPAASPGGHRALHVVCGERPRRDRALQILPDAQALHGLQQEADRVQAGLGEVQDLHREQLGMKGAVRYGVRGEARGCATS